MIYTRSNAFRGALIYAAGDTVAAFILGQFSIWRLLGMMLVGGTLYALEIPNYFRWIDKQISPAAGVKSSLQKAGLAMLYFNPLWIARHLLFIKVFSGEWLTISWSLLATATWSFVLNIPLSLLANYLIQNRVPLKWRFTGSAVFSGLMAIYYALSAVWFT